MCCNKSLNSLSTKSVAKLYVLRVNFITVAD